MKRSDLRLRIADACEDTSMVFFEEAEINASIDEAMEVIAERTKCVRRTAFVSIREGANFYFLHSIASDIMYPYRLWNEHRNQRLEPTSMPELDGFNRTWLDTSGDPDRWFPVSWDYFGIYPHAATAGGVIRIDYIAWPRELLDDDDEIELPESASDAVFGYSTYEGQCREWNDAGAAAWWQIFNQQLGETNAKTGIRRTQESDLRRRPL